MLYIIISSSHFSTLLESAVTPTGLSYEGCQVCEFSEVLDQGVLPYADDTFLQGKIYCIVFVFMLSTISPCTTGLKRLYDPSDCKYIVGVF